MALFAKKKKSQPLIDPELAGKTFEFLTVDQAYYGLLTLKENGEIEGYKHPNEASWGLADGNMVMYSDRGEITSRFPTKVRLADGALCLRGSVENGDPSIVQLLIERPPNDTVLHELSREIFSGETPFSNADPSSADDKYPHTNIDPEIIGCVLELVKPRLWLEIGSMLGGSAIKTADEIKRRNQEVALVCVDPFTGDADMWRWDRARRAVGLWQFLNLKDGQPRILQRFLANVRAAGHDDLILPIPVSSIVGLKLLKRLHAERRLSILPQVIYLDSAHEPDETLLELQECWSVLEKGGVLMGDDWNWGAVRRDVLKFACSVQVDVGQTQKMKSLHPSFTELEGILLDRNLWMLCK